MRRWIWLAGAVLPIAGTQAQAQSSVPVVASAEPANISVADRIRPEYSPIGGRLGSFFLYPRLDVSTQYNSNLYATPTNATSDVVVDLRPSLDLQSQWTQNRLDFNIYYDKTLHGKYTTENFSQYGGSASGTYDAGDTTIFNATATASRLTEPRTDINSVFYNGNGNLSAASRSPIQYSNLGFSGSVQHDFARLNMIATGSVAKQSFDDAVAFDGTPLPQGFRDNHTLDGSVEGRYLVGAGTRILARAEVSSITYDQNPYAGYDRNSRAYRFEGGVSLNITRLLQGELRVGYFTQDNFDRRFIDSSGLSFSANMLYNPTALTSIRLYADRSIQPGGSTVTSGNVISTVAVTVDHELLPNLVVTGYGRFTHINPQGQIGDADEYEGRASLRYYLSRRFRFTASVDQFSRRSNALGTVDPVTGAFGFGSVNVFTGSLGVGVTL